MLPNTGANNAPPVIQAKKSNRTPKFTYTPEKIVGMGTFGIVYEATCQETGEVVAIKKVMQDRAQFKFRELQILRELYHPNIVILKHAFLTYGPVKPPPEGQENKRRKKKDINRDRDIYLNAVMDYMPETVHKVIDHYKKQKLHVPLILVKLYSY